MSTLAQYFVGIAMKRLVSGELPYNPSIGRNSTQHEFNSTKDFIKLFGSERIESKQTTYFYFSDKEEDVTVESGSFSFYNSREGKPRPPEWRIYYSSKNSVVDKANEGDLLFIGKTLDNRELFIIAENNSTVAQQLVFLFKLEVKDTFQVKDLSNEKSRLEFVQKHILNNIGIEIEDSRDDILEEMLDRFKGDFPKTIQFSEFARYNVKNANPIENPDDALVRWYEMEYELFKTLERHFISQKLDSGFGKNGKDVEDFLKFSLSIHQRRKSRSGDAFENHLTEIFKRQELSFTPQCRIGKARPDYIFPGEKYYHEKEFPTDLLTMLGAKTTAKERWKQLIPESKINPKHFITLEPAISKNQTDDMIDKRIQLVVPSSIVASYKPEQQERIMNLADFINLVKERQRQAKIW